MTIVKHAVGVENALELVDALVMLHHVMIQRGSIVKEHAEGVRKSIDAKFVAEME
jgi:hypothetical protein